MPELEVLQNAKEKLEEVKNEVLEIIEQKFNEAAVVINTQINSLYRNDEELPCEDEENDEEESAQEKLNQTLLSLQIRNQLNVVPEDEEVSIDAPVVDVVASESPTIPLSELIKNQLTNTNESPEEDLASVIAKQRESQENLSVVSPENAAVSAPTPARPMTEIISELRNNVEVQVDSASQDTINQLTDQAATATPENDASDHSEGLAQAIATQVLSDQIKKQL
ncbi:hypothetical protein MOF23_07160 [Bacillus inaquosorum]|uniref:hypothetical protein n=1 Tax=Bacillus inaquosorum TaxID=483913 RepID=UPI002282A47C|nr:hypothetical protein [Bacillus inaquosorum]MCY9308755.1 hypothetical protein [Bacillus inaquosorum]